ncbi:unnamed protein product [Closterium sp. Yama58-4]|nr:unnamed protein product [Closterium sp. Yama58-4]
MRRVQSEVPFAPSVEQRQAPIGGHFYAERPGGAVGAEGELAAAGGMEGRGVGEDAGRCAGTFGPQPVASFGGAGFLQTVKSKGLSAFIGGKSRSFTSLADVAAIRSMSELAKPLRRTPLHTRALHLSARNRRHRQHQRQRSSPHAHADGHAHARGAASSSSSPFSPSLPPLASSCPVPGGVTGRRPAGGISKRAAAPLQPRATLALAVALGGLGDLEGAGERRGSRGLGELGEAGGHECGGWGANRGEAAAGGLRAGGDVAAAAAGGMGGGTIGVGGGEWEVRDMCRMETVPDHHAHFGNMVVAQAARTREAISEKESLQLTRNLLRIAVFNISYIRGLFPEKYFDDKYVPALEMKIKKLMPVDPESKRLIDWMEQGVYDALQKKYLKTMVFAICESDGTSLLEEYTFNFSYASQTGDVSLNISKSGSKDKDSTFKSVGSDATPAQMKNSACKLVRTLVQLMRTLDNVPNERTIIVKLLYHEDVTVSAGLGAEMKVGDVDSKHYSIALKVRSVLDPCDNNEEQQGSQSNGTETSGQSSESEEDENGSGKKEGSIRKTGDLPGKKQDDETSKLMNTSPTAALSLIRSWILSRPTITVDVMDVFANFPDASLVSIEEIMDQLVGEGRLKAVNADLYSIIHGDVIGQEEPSLKNHSPPLQKPLDACESDEHTAMYHKALEHVFNLEYVTIANLHNRKKGRKVLRSKKIQAGMQDEKHESKEGIHATCPSPSTRSPLADQLKTASPSAVAQVCSLGSDMTRSRAREASVYKSDSGFKEPPSLAKDKKLSRKAPPEVSSTGYEKMKLGPEPGLLGELEFVKESQDTINFSNPRVRKASTVVEPIQQTFKKQRSSASQGPGSRFTRS